LFWDIFAMSSRPCTTAWWLGSFVGLAVLAGTSNAQAQDPTTVLLVRHAERADNSANSPLSSPDGLARADALARVALPVGIEAIYATETCRTTQTVQPLALLLDLPIQIQPVGVLDGIEHCEPEIVAKTLLFAGNMDALVDTILQDHAGGAVLIAGHSNTVPPMIEAFGAPCPTSGCDTIDDDAFDNLFVVTVFADSVTGGDPVAALAHLKYGAP
jgi:hypothetical protein